MSRERRSVRRTVRLAVSPSSGTVSGILLRPPDARALLVFAHGAGADMRHAFMEGVATTLAERHIATLRYNFPYTENGLRRPDSKPVLLATVRSAIHFANRVRGPLPLFAGGKSMGGRMTSAAAAEEPLPNVAGIIFFGFPLHPAGAPSTERAAHLAEVTAPMLFLQGTRDLLADLTLLKPELSNLGTRASLHVVEGADHSFHVPKRTGRSDNEVLAELAGVVSEWCRAIASA